MNTTDHDTELKASNSKQGAKSGARKKIVFATIGVGAVISAGWFGWQWWNEGRFMISTDDAYIAGDIATIAPKVSGYVESVAVKNNQRVKMGDLLIKVEDGDYVNAVKQENAKIVVQKLMLERIDTQVKGAEATLEQVKANRNALDPQLHNAQIAFKRADKLKQQGAVTEASLDNARSTLDQIKAKINASDAAIDVAKSDINSLKAEYSEQSGVIQELTVARDQASRNLSFTEMRAPLDGIFGNKNVQVGDLVSSGTRLGSLVPTQALYINANFKETDLEKLGVGEEVRVRVDAFEDHDFTGQIVSFSPATGSVFALLPPQNATGNFTKIVQRIPVRISIPENVLKRGHLRAGLSVIVDVDSRTAPNGTLGELSTSAE